MTSLQAAGSTFLKVSRSLTGQRWRDRLDDGAHANALSMVQELGLSDALARVLAGRGVSVEEAEAFLQPRLRDLMPDPLVLRDMEPAVERLARAVTGGQTVGIFGDYDVDGACSVALLVQGLQAAGVHCLFHIPDRMTEGYGPNSEALNQLHAQGAALVVTGGMAAAGGKGRPQPTPNVSVAAAADALPGPDDGAASLFGEATAIGATAGYSATTCAIRCGFPLL
jgi:single-stranded-DNA-specific exonuclease